MSFSETDLAAALCVLELHALLPSRRALAVRVNRLHPGRAVWTKENTAAYRLLWELLQERTGEAAAA
ncbi:hypothetical protein [Synechococcus sp. 1G10]|uniref:hypothetical protein n=1 Tax=Synechococcus sp. 1G10 TaxID=2025605 RepID=UPI0011806792|nr:hypothetical protein [Synechococcus sp. 1G10]